MTKTEGFGSTKSVHNLRVTFLGWGVGGGGEAQLPVQAHILAAEALLRCWNNSHLTIQYLTRSLTSTISITVCLPLWRSCAQLSSFNSFLNFKLSYRQRDRQTDRDRESERERERDRVGGERESHTQRQRLCVCVGVGGRTCSHMNT